MIAKTKRRVTITLPKDLDDFLDLTVKCMNEKDPTGQWSKSKLIERTLLIHINMAEDIATEDKNKA